MADATFDPVPKNEWDVAAGAAIVIAGGGRVSGRDGEDVTFDRPRSQAHRLRRHRPRAGGVGAQADRRDPVPLTPRGATMTLPSSLHSMIPVGPMVPLGVPDEFRRLNDLAYNLWWSWQHDAIDLFRSIDPVAWDRSGNPMAMLHTVEPATWARLAEEEDCVTSYGSVTADFDRYLEGADTWYATNHAVDGSEALDAPVAYLSTEFGLHESLGVYSGGLGRPGRRPLQGGQRPGRPLVGVGLLYRRGYFRQTWTRTGASSTSTRLRLRPAARREVLVRAPAPVRHSRPDRPARARAGRRAGRRRSAGSRC